jgi:hypothetical protein
MTIVLIATACFVLNIKVAQPQSKKESLRPDAPISETMAWLKSHIPYTYMLPTASNGEVQRWTIGGLHSKGCKLSYDITIQTLGSDTGFQRQLWEVDLAGLNPQMIRIQPATKDDPARIEFTSFDWKEFIRQAQANGGVVMMVERGNAIWQNLRQDNHFVREGFESRASFFTRNEERARELAAALKRGIELCRQKQAAD